MVSQGSHEAGKLDAALARQRREALDLLGDDVAQADVGDVEVHAAAVDVDQRQKVADDAVEAVDLLVDVGEELLLHPGIVVLLIEQRFQEDLHRAQRRLQLVGGVGDELVARHIQFFQPLGHGVEGAGQLGELVFAPHLHAGGEVAAAHARYAGAQFADGAGDGAHHEHADDQRRGRHQQHPQKHLAAQGT